MRRDQVDFMHSFAGLQLIRIMSWTDYTPCENGGAPRQFFRRLTTNDPRPMGRRTLDCCCQAQIAWFRALPVNEWVQIGSEEMAGPKGVLP